MTTTTTCYDPECPRREHFGAQCTSSPARCPMPCDMTCISCAERAPAFDVPDVGPLCGPCTGNGQGEPNTELATDHEHKEESWS